ncbi:MULTISPECIES: hypothetical protein [Paraburkholderia]|uniref:hypothetical protein n=1 Tax=Paraburkholderia TaxID=1822464 RepID=UPI0022585966|nr:MULTISPECIES: hypothetical protein [Paraburkholderia]MCX4176109.1 hypothetical protein [Paraburkholderia madseniana]MDQ6464103.1 hypothetical protein [Paraburkholderia madseniana]
MEHFFEGKKILFIGPKFFGYEREIAGRLRQLGAHVEYHDDRPSADPFVKVAIRRFPVLIKRKLAGYFEQILDNASNDFDFVFIIKLECMPLRILHAFRSKLSRARFIYYSWDSVRNNPNFQGAASSFDALYTFDTEDAGQDPRLKLRPLFFLNEFRELPVLPTQYDLCFVGTVHSDRYALLRKIRQFAQTNGKSTMFYMFVPHKAIYWVRRIFSPAFWTSSRQEFAFDPLPKKEVHQIIAKSRAVLDFQHPGQTGLTMRTIEMVGARKKLVTTNALVRRYEFFRPENILVVDRDNPQLDPAFFETPYSELAPELYEKYSLDGWIRELFSVPAAPLDIQE